MLAGSTQQLLHPRKNSHLQEGHIPSAVSEPFSTLCQSVCRSLSVKTKHIDSKTWPCHSSQSATDPRASQTASVEDTGGKVTSSSPVGVNR